MMQNNNKKKVKMGIYISRKNFEYLQNRKKQGNKISQVIDIALNYYRDRNEWKQR